MSWQVYKEIILALQAGMDILTIEEPWKASEILSGAKPILIVEGMSVGFLPKELFDKTICFYTDEETELKEASSSRYGCEKWRRILYIG